MTNLQNCVILWLSYKRQCSCECCFFCYSLVKQLLDSFKTVMYRVYSYYLG
ncbi:hypothetical protein [Clostridium phage Maintenon]|nr:hypothetical protein [Clostridium phage Maintenon]DAH53214.1 MAG TPA: Protein of unknown function (DUF3709) [Caudoviricetes sp.]